MDKIQLFQSLSSQDSSVLLNLLTTAYDEMNHDQRQAVFGQHARALRPVQVDAETLLKQVEEFRRESLAA